MGMMKHMTTLIVFVLGLVIGFVLINGRWQSYEMLFGPGDLGPVDITTLSRNKTGNDALACPRGWCAAASDFEPPVYALKVGALAQRFAESLNAESKLEVVDNTAGGLRLRFVQYTPLMEFPDTIQVDFLSLDENRSTLAIYSRSKYGYGDMGTNLARIKRWLERLHPQEEATGVLT
ncbi:MAG: DUF1499 domain-containing protein [Nitratireductor sp.]